MGSAEPFTQRRDSELIQLILDSSITPEEKVRVVLAARERQVTDRHNKVLLWLTLAAAIGAVAQGVSATLQLYLVVHRPESVQTGDQGSHPKPDSGGE